MDPLSAFGVVCNVIQVVDFGLQTISTCREIALRGSTASNLDAEYASGHIRDLSKELQSSLEISLKTNTALSAGDRQLKELAQKSEECAKELVLKLNKLKLGQKKGKFQAFAKTIELIWKRGELTDVENRLERLRRTLDTRILARLCQAQNLQMIQQRKEFEALNQAAKNIHTNLLAGHKNVIGLVTVEHKKTRDQITSQGLAVRSKIKDEHDITRLQVQTEAAAMRQQFHELRKRQADAQTATERENQLKQLKESLWYPAVKHRQQMIDDAHHYTFAWILKGDERESAIGSPDSNPDSDLQSLGSHTDVSDDEEESADDERSAIDSAESNLDSDPEFLNSHTDVSDGAGSAFSAWLREGSGVFWISGKAGSGKSTLVNFIVQHPRTQALLQQWAQSRKIIVPTFFFWNSGTLEEKSISGFLRSLIAQILDKYPAALETALLSVHLNLSTSTLQIPTWTVRQLITTLKHLLSATSNECRYCIFIDGADELADDYQDFLRLLKEISALEHVKICISSRPLYDFEREFQGCPSLKLEDLTWNDMKFMVQDRLLKHPDFHKLAEDLGDGMCEKLVGKAEGVFLWLVLALRDIEQGLSYMDSAEQIRDHLNDLPDGLDAMYTRTIDRIPARYRAQSAKILQYMLVCTADPTMAWTTVLFLTLMDEHSLLRIFNGGQGCDEVMSDYRNVLPSMDAKCERMDVHIRTRCSGLLDITRTDSRHSIFAEVKDLVMHIPNIPFNQRQPMIRWWDFTVSFHHRTLKDFLMESRIGATLISSSSFENEDIVNAKFSALAASFGTIQAEMMAHANIISSCGSYWQRKINGSTMDRDWLVAMFKKAGEISAEFQEETFLQMEAVLVAFVKVGADQLSYFRPDYEGSKADRLGPCNDLLGLLTQFGFAELAGKRLAVASRQASTVGGDFVTYLLSCALSGVAVYSAAGVDWVKGYEPPVQLIKDLLLMQANPNAMFGIPHQPKSLLYQSWHQYLAALCEWSGSAVWDYTSVLKDFIAAGADLRSNFIIGRNYPWFMSYLHANTPGFLRYHAEFLMSPLGVLKFCIGNTPGYVEMEQTLTAADAPCTQAMRSRKMILYTNISSPAVEVLLEKQDCAMWLTLWSQRFHTTSSKQTSEQLDAFNRCFWSEWYKLILRSKKIEEISQVKLRERRQQGDYSNVFLVEQADLDHFLELPASVDEYIGD